MSSLKAVDTLVGRSIGAATVCGLGLGLYVGAYLVTHNVVHGFASRLAVLALMGVSYAALALPMGLLLFLMALYRQRRGDTSSLRQLTVLAVFVVAAAICLRHALGAAEDLRAGYPTFQVIADRVSWALPAIVAITLTQLLGRRHRGRPAGAATRSLAITCGLTVVALLVISVLPAPDARGTLRQTRPSSLNYQSTENYSVSGDRHRVVLIGFDGIDPTLLDVFIAGGHMPTFAKLKQEAAYNKLETSPEGLSPPIWTTFATGVGPAKHGIHDFFVRRLLSTRLDLSMLKNRPKGFATSTLLGTIIRSRLVTEQPITPSHRNAPALWSLAAKAKLSSCVIDWMGTWPAEQINGTMVSDRAFFARNQGDLAVVTTDITGTKLPLRLMATEQLASSDQEPELCSPTPQCQEFLPSIAAGERVDVHQTGDFHVAENDFYLRTAERMLGSDSCSNADLIVFYSHLPDFLNHILNPEELDHLYAGRYSGELERLSLHVYKEVDRTLGRLLELVGSDPAVLVFSDHGVEIVGEGPTREVSHFHGPPGIFFSRTSKGRQSASLTMLPNIYEIAPTTLALLGLPLPDFLDGGVIEGVAIAEFGNNATIRTIDMRLERNAAEVRGQSNNNRIDETARERLRALGYVE